MSYEKKNEAILTKGLTKDLLKGYKILNGAKYFSSEIFQKQYLLKIIVFIQKQYFSIYNS